MGTNDNVESAYIVVSTRPDPNAGAKETKYLFLERVDCGIYPAGILDLPGGLHRTNTIKRHLNLKMNRKVYKQERISISMPV